ncbi:MAG: hypothetical protein V1734_06470 [Nanoarchaeota archaeon]
MAEIIKELNSIQGKTSALFIMKAEGLQGGLEQTIKLFTGKKMSGACICLNKSYKTLKAQLESKKINTKNLLFIDALTGNKNEAKTSENVVLVSNPAELTSISLAAVSFAKGNKGNKFIVIDALSTLLIYNQANSIAKFIMKIISLTTSDDLSLVVLTTESKGSTLINKIEPFFDRIARV